MKPGEAVPHPIQESKYPLAMKDCQQIVHFPDDPGSNFVEQHVVAKGKSTVDGDKLSIVARVDCQRVRLMVPCQHRSFANFIPSWLEGHNFREKWNLLRGNHAW